MKELPEIYNVYDDVTYQQNIQTIVDNEKTRLAKKTTDIGALHQTQRRQDYMKKMSVRRSYALWKMFAVVVTLAIVMIFFVWIIRTFPVPELISVLTILSVLAVGMVYLFFLSWDYLRRDNLNYDELYSVSPETQAQVLKRQQTLLQDGDITAAMKAGLGTECVGAACCTYGTYGNKKCQ